jgi:signal transduction histidine kinase/CheY-like chemotaxis protein
VLQRVKAWLERIPCEDPFERRSAVVVQIFCIGLAVLLVAMELVRTARGAPLGALEWYSVFANWASFAASVGGVVLIRQGRTRPGFLAVLGGYLGILAGSLALRGLEYHQHFLARVFAVLLVLAALLLGRRALWTSLLVLVVAMFAGHLRDRLVGILPPVAPPLGVWPAMVAVMGLLAVILDRFGAALREAYAAAWHRQWQAERAVKDLSRANAALSLEIDRRAAAEALLFQSQKLEAMGRLAGGVAHDMNNMLTAVIGFAQLARDSLPGKSPQISDLDGIIEAAQHGGGLTRNLLAFARRQVVEPRVLTVESRLETLRSMLPRVVGETLRIEVRPSPAPWSVRMDPVQLDQVLLNLAVNARDACPRGGTLTFETETVTLTSGDEVVALGLPPGEFVHVAVTDTGEGMDAATLATAFEPFFTTKEAGKGTGIGLATCSVIVKQAGGAMRARSEVGRGTTFDIFLPRASEAPPEQAAAPVVVGWRGGETILLVEDEPQVLSVAERALASQGYRVLTAPDAERALAVARDHRGEIALLLTDVMLPGMNGRQLAGRLAETRPHLPVLFTSGYSHEVIAHQGVLDPQIALLPKPYTPDALLARVAPALVDGAQRAARAAS